MQRRFRHRASRRSGCCGRGAQALLSGASAACKHLRFCTFSVLCRQMPAQTTAVPTAGPFLVTPLKHTGSGEARSGPSLHLGPNPGGQALESGTCSGQWGAGTLGRGLGLRSARSCWPGACLLATGPRCPSAPARGPGKGRKWQMSAGQ